MTLKEYMEVLPKDRVIYIGAQSAYLVAGYVDKELKYKDKVFPPLSVQIDEQDVKNQETYESSREKAEGQYKKYLRRFGEDNLITQSVKMEIEKAPPTSYWRRKVLEVWDKAVEDALCLKIDGTEIGKIFSIRDEDAIDIQYNEEMIIGAVFKDLVKDYKKIFRNELKTMKALLDKLQKYMHESRGYERYIRYLCGTETYTDEDGKEHMFPNKLFGVANPEKIINEARREVVEAMQEREEAKRIKGKKE